MQACLDEEGDIGDAGTFEGPAGFEMEYECSSRARSLAEHLRFRIRKALRLRPKDLDPNGAGTKAPAGAM